MTTTKRYLAKMMLSLILLALAGCGSGVPPRSAALDPSNADNPESPPFSVSLAATDGAASGETSEPNRPDPSALAGSSDGSVIYTCPMHPEVTSSQPGECPKCGMKLVPKKDGP